MKLGFVGAFISAMIILVALGGLAWSVYSAPRSSVSESVGLHNVLYSQRQSISDNWLNVGWFMLCKVLGQSVDNIKKNGLSPLFFI